MVDWYKDKVEIAKEAYEKGSKNCQILSPDIQKDLTKVCAEEVTSVYRLIELTLILPVATTSIERIFSVMSIIKTDLRSKMGDEWLNGLMICYNEKEIFRKIGNEKIKKRFEEMKKRRMLLAKKLMIASSDE